MIEAWGSMGLHKTPPSLGIGDVLEIHKGWKNIYDQDFKSTGVDPMLSNICESYSFHNEH